MKAKWLLLTAALLTSCAVTIYDRSTVQLQDPSFTFASAQDGGMALLPITAGQGQEGYRRPLGTYIAVFMDSFRASIPFTNTQQTMDKLNNAGITSEYTQMIRSYRETSILDQAILGKMGEALSVRYLLFVSLEDFSKSSQVTYDIYSGYGSREEATVNAFCQVWDAEAGRVVWEALGVAESTKVSEFEIDQPYEKYAIVVAQGIVTLLPF